MKYMLILVIAVFAAGHVIAQRATAEIARIETSLDSVRGVADQQQKLMEAYDEIAGRLVRERDRIAGMILWRSDTVWKKHKLDSFASEQARVYIRKDSAQRHFDNCLIILDSLVGREAALKERLRSQK